MPNYPYPEAKEKTRSITRSLGTQPVLLAVILLLATFLRLPSLFEPYWHGDEGITLAVGQEISRGERIYQEIADNKPPLLYLVTALAQDLFRLRLLTTIWVIIGLAGFWFLSLKLLSQPIALITTVIAGLGLSLPLVEANITNGEIWFVPPIIWGVLLISSAASYTNPPPRAWLYLTPAGALLGTGVLFKIPAALDTLALVVFSLTTLKLKNALTSLNYLFLGLALPWLIVLGWLFSQGGLIAFIKEAIVNNLFYTTIWGSDPLFGHSRLLAKGVFLGLTSFSVWRQRQKISFHSKLLCLWLAFALVGSLLSNRPYRHYALQVIPPLSLSLGWLLDEARRSWQARHLVIEWLSVLVLVVGATTLTGWFFGFGTDNLRSQFNYYRRFFKYLTHQEETSYLSSFDPQVPTLYRARAIVTHFTEPEAKLFIWGNNWLVYSLANRPLTGKYPADFLINDLANVSTLTIGQLELDPPQLILLSKPQRYPLPGLAKLINQGYDHLAQVNHVAIYQKN